MTPLPFWLMIVSMAMAVLPVLRSPMISSRWPRPIGVMASMALMPVCSGSSTGWRSATPGAVDSTSRRAAGDDRPLVVDRLAQRVDHAADHGVADRHAEQLAGRRDGLPLVDAEVVAQDDDADGRLFEVEGQPADAVLEADHLAGHDAREAVDAGDAVADLQHAPDLGPVTSGLELLDLALND